MTGLDRLALMLCDAGERLLGPLNDLCEEFREWRRQREVAYLWRHRFYGPG